MSYASAADLSARYGTEVLDWADRDRDGSADADLLAAVLADADAEIDAYLAARYTLPLTAIPAVINRIACALVRERLALGNGARLDATDPVRADAEGARKLLQAIGAGKASIGLPDPAPSTGGVQMTPGSRVWGRGDSGGYL